MRASAFVLPATLSLLLACSSTSDGTSVGDGGASCTGSCVDLQVGIALVGLCNTLYNANLAGKPVGTVSVSASCPVAGTAKITGTVGASTSNNLTTINLTYAMTGCGVVSGATSVTFDGTVTLAGSFDSASYQSENAAASSLTYAGTFAGATVSGTACPAHVNDDTTASPRYSGSLCGRPF